MHNLFKALVVTIIYSTLVYGAVLNQIGRLYIPDSDFTGAENVAIVTKANKLFTADGANLGLNVINFAISNDYSTATMTYQDTIFFSFEDFLTFNKPNITLNDVTSVDYSPKDYLITALVPDDYYVSNGWLAIINPYDSTITNLIELTDCHLPDHVTTAKQGNLIIVSCEGEPDDNEVANPTYNPRGSIAMIDVSSDNMNQWTVTNVGFTDFDTGGSKADQLPFDIYLPHLDASKSANIEPEYASCDYDDKFCYIALQENNAVAILDIEAKEIIAIYTLGTRDFSINGLDASDKDDGININTYPYLYGLRMPDNIKYFESRNGRKYFTTANEGDSKEFDEARVGSLKLDENRFGNTTELQMDDVLGRLKVLNQLGDSNNDGIYTELYALSSRDFTIFEVTNTDSIPTIQQVFSSESDFEIITSDELGEPGFNCNQFVPSFDSRSDDKGPEPECIMVGKCANGREYVFIGLERVGGIMVYDATYIDDGIVTFVEYVNNRDFNITIPKDERAPENAGDVGPEQLRFIEESVYGVPLLVVANAESASVTIYSVNCEDIIISTKIGDDDDTSTTMIGTGSTDTTSRDNANRNYSFIRWIIMIIGTILCSY